ncbi:MAG: DUF1559 domain-containing protein [Opitutaceae bacterium]|nr:DUF1559 domain-containing protein [Opitutaceae bacterium]
MQAARKTAHHAKCISQLRQIQMAMQSYSLEYKGCYPKTIEKDGDGRDLSSWRDAILSYVGMKKLITLKNSSSNSVFFCPIALAEKTDADGNCVSTYAMNSHLSAFETSRVSAPSRTGVLMEGAYSNKTWYSSIGHNATSPGAPHKGKTHVSFVDGHVSAITVPAERSDVFWSPE